MIARLKGTVAEIAENHLVLDVGGVGYLVFAPARVLARLATGEEVVLAIETHVREDHIHLYGFADAADRAMFRLLCGVSGVGARLALALLSVLDAEALSLAPLVSASGWPSGSATSSRTRSAASRDRMAPPR